MKKMLSIILMVMMVLSFTFTNLSGVPHAKAATVWYVNANTGSDTNSGTSPSSAFKTITKAINSASNGDTIQIANGTYNRESATITIDKEVSLIGESENGVIIDASSYSGYGIYITANNVTLKNFTLKNASSYGIHSAGAENLDFENLTVENSGRSNIDFNGCSNITLDNITAKNSTHGVGIALTDSHSATVSNITTYGNVWGNGQSMGMAVYTYGRYYPGGSSDITLTGTNSFGEPVPLYVETDNFNGGADYPVTNLSVSGDFASIARLPATLPHQIYFFRDLNSALNACVQLVSNGFLDAVASNISDISTNGIISTLPASDYKNYYVGAGMYIQSAVNAAVNGDTIFVLPGTYTENVVVNKSVTLKGAENHTSIITASDKAVVSIDASNVTLYGFTIEGGVAGVYVYGAAGAEGALIRNNIIKDYSGYYGDTNDPACPGPYIGEGILMNGGEAIIHKNTIEANEDGTPDPQHSIDSIYLKNGAQATITQNILRNNHYGGTSCHASASGISIKSNCTATIMGNTIYDNDFGIHPEVKTPSDSNPIVTARYNNIYKNGENNGHPFSTPCLDGSGFLYEKSYHYNDQIPNPDPPFDATYNWWGENDKSGPYNALENPNGTGNRIGVSKNIDPSDVQYIHFDPWAGKAGDKTEGNAEGVTGGTASLDSIDNTFENGTIGMGVDTTPNGNGGSDVMLVKYSQNPTSVSFTASYPGSFYDMNVTEPANLSKVVLKLYYPASHGNLAPFWFDKTENKWKLCSNWTVVPGNVTVDTCNVDNSSYAGFVAVTVDNTTSPSLSELTGTYFALGGFKLTVNIVGSGTVINDPDPDYYTSGTVVTLTANPATGWHFDGYSGDITTSNNPATITMDSDKTVTATFTVNTYTITASAGPGGSITPSGNVTVNYGGSETFTITPDAGYMISRIIVDGKTVYVPHTYKATYTFKDVKSDHTIRAEFIRKPKPMFTVTAKVETFGGNAEITPKVQTVPSGSPAKVTINPEAGYHIVKFTDNNKVVPLSMLIKNANGTFTYKIDAVYEDHHLVVTLERDKFVISVKAGEGGTISPSGTSGKVIAYYGENKTFKITPESGYEIKEVLVDGKAVNIENSEYTFFAVKANHSIEVQFKKVTQTEHKNIVIVLKIGDPFITANGAKKAIDAQGSKPIIKNNRTLLPIRVIIESLGGKISWNGKTREVTIELDGHTIVLKIGSNIALVDGVKTQIDPANSKVVPIIINGRTYLPLRFIAEHLNATVVWDGVTRTITLYYWK